MNTALFRRRYELQMSLLYLTPKVKISYNQQLDETKRINTFE